MKITRQFWYDSDDGDDDRDDVDDDEVDDDDVDVEHALHPPKITPEILTTGASVDAAFGVANVPNHHSYVTLT